VDVLCVVDCACELLHLPRHYAPTGGACLVALAIPQLMALLEAVGAPAIKTGVVNGAIGRMRFRSIEKTAALPFCYIKDWYHIWWQRESQMERFFRTI
jgi:hypothetical protein